MEMEMQFMSCLYPESRKCGKRPWCWHQNPKQKIAAIHFRVNFNYGLYQQRIYSGKRGQNYFRTRVSKNNTQLTDISVNGSEKKGTIVGAVALIIGTSIGSGILALPERTSPAGLVPSSVSMILCWGFLLIEALLLAEINVGLSKKKMMSNSKELEVISIRTMAQETLGEWGGTLATVTYLFLGYTTMVAYTSKSGDILYHLINIPSSISGFFFTILFTVLISVGGTRTTDQINQWLTITMIGLLAAIEVLAVVYGGGWSGLDGQGNWGKLPSTFPVIIFSLVYHDLSPVICSYLDGDLARIRVSFILGSLVPLFALLIWNAVALGLSAHSDQVFDPVDLLKGMRWSGASALVEAFALLAVGTSLLGTLLGFSQFFLEQLNNHTSKLNSIQNQKLEERVVRDEISLFGLREWWGSNKLGFTAKAMVVAPSLLISTTFPDAFSAATDIAGGYCMTILYGVLPPAMAWAMHTRSSVNAGDSVKVSIDAVEEDNGRQMELSRVSVKVGNDAVEEDNGRQMELSRVSIKVGNDAVEEDHGRQMELSRVKPALITVGLISCGIVIEQISKDLSSVLLPP